jgi:hypothetical protein
VLSLEAEALVTNMMLGNFVGPLVFKTKDAPRYVPAFITVTVTAILAGTIAITYRYICVWQNKKRDEAGIAEAFDHAYEDDLTDLKVCNHVRSRLSRPCRLQCYTESAVQICSLGDFRDPTCRILLRCFVVLLCREKGPKFIRCGRQ